MLKAELCTGLGELAWGESRGEELSSDATKGSEWGHRARVSMVEAAGRMLLHFPELMS